VVDCLPASGVGKALRIILDLPSAGSKECVSFPLGSLRLNLREVHSSRFPARGKDELYIGTRVAPGSSFHRNAMISHVHVPYASLGKIRFSSF